MRYLQFQRVVVVDGGVVVAVVVTGVAALTAELTQWVLFAKAPILLPLMDLSSVDNTSKCSYTKADGNAMHGGF